MQNGYIPEHLVGLMSHLSGGEPFLINNFFCCIRKDWVVLVGYPLHKDFRTDQLEDTIGEIKQRFRPTHLSLIAPRLPNSVSKTCHEQESDCYYTLEAQSVRVQGGVKRNLRKASQALSIERGHCMGREHQLLAEEFLNRVNPPAEVRELLAKMPDYVHHNESCLVLNAWDSKGNLSAFYIVDLWASDFSSYTIGCYSTKNYVLGASDLLMVETIDLSLRHEKKYIHLGLGVNAGVRRFKEKWGAKPTLTYEKCEISFGRPSILDTIFSIKKPG